MGVPRYVPHARCVLHCMYHVWVCHAVCCSYHVTVSCVLCSVWVCHAVCGSIMLCAAHTVCVPCMYCVWQCCVVHCMYCVGVPHCALHVLCVCHVVCGVNWVWQCCAVSSVYHVWQCRVSRVGSRDPVQSSHLHGQEVVLIWQDPVGVDVLLEPAGSQREVSAMRPGPTPPLLCHCIARSPWPSPFASQVPSPRINPLSWVLEMLWGRSDDTKLRGN